MTIVNTTKICYFVIILFQKNMLIPSQYNQKGIFERVLRSKDGQLMRVCFEVYEVNGEIKGRIIKAEPILSLNRSSAEQPSHDSYINGFGDNYGTNLLLASANKIVSPYSWILEKKITSPFSEFEFLTSIKIRAPSFK